MVKTCDKRSRWEKVRDNIYADIMDNGISADDAGMMADIQTDKLFAQIADKGIDITNKRIDVSKSAPIIASNRSDESEPPSDYAEFIALVDYEVNEIRELKDIGEGAGIGWMFDAFDIRFDHRGMKATFADKELSSESLIVALLTRPGFIERKNDKQEWLIAEQRAGEAKLEADDDSH